MTTRHVVAAAVVTTVLAAVAAGLGAGASAPADVQPALDRALDDERYALAFYKQVIAAHGERRPFSNVVFAERRHEGALLEQYRRLELTPPSDGWTDRALDVPETFRDACDAAEFAEIRNVRLYDDLIAAVDDEQVREVFGRLRAASAERHLPAFRRHGSGWHVLTMDEATPAQQTQVARAGTAQNELFGAIFGRLQAEMRSHGAAQAVTVCKDAAPALAAEAAAKHGVSIGRTSWKLRNPNNSGPGWTTLVLGDRPQTPQLLADRTGRLGYVAPIRIMGVCLTCHGPRESIAPEVIERLDELYPEDRATGFNAGDLRGWFWVEVPAEGSEGS